MLDNYAVAGERFPLVHLGNDPSSRDDEYSPNE